MRCPNQLQLVGLPAREIPRNPKVTFHGVAAVLVIEDANSNGSSGVSEMRVGTQSWVRLPALQV